MKQEGVPCTHFLCTAASGKRSPLRFSPGSCPHFPGKTLYVHLDDSLVLLYHTFGWPAREREREREKGRQKYASRSEQDRVHGSRRMLIIHVCCLDILVIHIIYLYTSNARINTKRPPAKGSTDPLLLATHPSEQKLYSAEYVWGGTIRQKQTKEFPIFHELLFLKRNLVFVPFFIFSFFLFLFVSRMLFNKIFDASRAAISMYAPSG